MALSQAALISPFFLNWGDGQLQAQVTAKAVAKMNHIKIISVTIVA
jgi:hypothetical protein